MTTSAVEHYKHPDTGYTRKRCEGNASCIPICPTGAKYDAAVHIRMALMASKKSGANNVTFQSGCPVTVVRKDSYGRVVGVSYRDTRTGAKTDTDVDAQIVVLAANGIETPRLWLHSKLENTQDVVGRYLMDHIQGEAVCMTPVPIHPFRGPQNTSSIPSFIDHPKRNQVSAFNVSVGNDGWGRYVNEKGQSKAPFNVLDELLWDSEAKKIKTFGKALQHKLAVDPETALTCRLRLSFSTEQLPSRDNRVTLADEKDALGVPRPKITYQLSDYTKRSIANARSICREILRNAGLSPDGPDDVPFEYAGAGHIMGTCRMGSDPTKSVVNAFGRSHAYQNLWVVGSSVFVTGSCTNPTVTLAALTIRTARAIASELS